MYKKRATPAQLASLIKEIPDALALSHFLRAHRIATICTHLLAAKPEPYRTNSLLLLRELSKNKGNVILLEAIPRTRERMEKTLAKESIDCSGFSFFYSTLGFITHLCAFDIFNQADEPKITAENALVLPKIESAIKRKVVFAFGLFPNRCFLHTQQDLQIIANQKGIFEFEIATSPLFDAPNS